MVGLRQCEGCEHLAARDGSEVPRLLLVAAEQRERAQCEAALHRDDGAHRPVAARDLHVHETRGQRREVRDALVLDAVGEQVELAQAPREVEVVLAAIPVVVDDRDHLVGERLRAIPRLAIGIRNLAEHRVEVGVEAAR